MTPETIFPLVNYGVLPFWLLLLLAPRWRGTQLLVHSALIPAVLGVIYLATIFAGPKPEGAGGLSLEGVSRIFTAPWLTLACWIHYLVLDLFTGAWEVRDATRRGISYWFVMPCLVLTNLFAPAGLLMYLLLRGALRRTWTLDEKPAA